MFKFQAHKVSASRKARIAKLQSIVDEALADIPDLDDPEERKAAEFHAASSVRFEQNEMDYLLQISLREDAERRGIEICSDRFWSSPDSRMYPILSNAGIAWLHREIKKDRWGNLERWSKLVVPYISLIVSIGALILSILKAH